MTESVIFLFLSTIPRWTSHRHSRRNKRTTSCVDARREGAMERSFPAHHQTPPGGLGCS